MIPIPPRVAAIAGRFTLSGIAIAILCVLLAVQTVRIEGFKVWPISVTGWKDRAMRAEQTIDDIAKAQELARAKARAAREAQEATYREIAERIDDNAQEQLDDAMAAAERFIAAGGVRPQADRGVGQRAGTSGARDSAGSPERTSGAPVMDAPLREPLIPEGFVMVPAGDIRICTTNTIKAEAGRALALELEGASGGSE